MIDLEKIKAIYNQALTDEIFFNDFLQNPENFKSNFNLTDSEIVEINTILNKTVSNKEMIGKFYATFKNYSTTLGAISIKPPIPWWPTFPIPPIEDTDSPR
ncbi:MAG: hypothetical protein IPM32_07310 [Ignavibacteriae bacterium]|nr:hypothetical protein [Ignavibacteriota bacterium]